MHVAQLMHTLPLTVSCFSKIQVGFTFLVSAHLGSPGKRAVKRVCSSVVDESRLIARLLPTTKPHQLTWVVNLPVGCYLQHPPLPFVIIYYLAKNLDIYFTDLHFTFLRIVEGYVELGTVITVCSSAGGCVSQ